MVIPIDITFLGTGSAQPSSSRNHQSIALRRNGEIWLFDAGEATQHQLQKSDLRMGRITKVFITHMHGDHCFGLPPLLCTMTDNLNPKRNSELGTVEVYGPKSLRRWLRMTLSSTYSRLGRPYRVHEFILNGQKEDEEDNGERHPDELPGENIRMVPGKDYFELLVENEWRVLVAPIQHSIPCLGYLVREPNVPGKLDHEAIKPHIERNAEALREQGYKHPEAILGTLRKTGKPVTLPDGTVIEPPPQKPGREVIVLGDTYDASSMVLLCAASQCNMRVLVHEATNALTRLDEDDTTLEQVEERARAHGHSTPQMAAQMALRMGAHKLLLTHFSARYKGDDSEEALEVMEEIRQLAVKELGKDRDADVFCAKDLWRYEIKWPSM